MGIVICDIHYLSSSSYQIVLVMVPKKYKINSHMQFVGEREGLVRNSRDLIKSVLLTVILKFSLH